MSDYLWDKRGEPDAEVARLEALLGAFAHEPRRLELPEAAPPETRRSWLPPFASRLFKPAALAAAAALLVAAALVASVFLRSGAADEDRRAAAPESPRPKVDARKDERPAPREAERVMPEPPPVKDGRRVESAAAGNLPNVARQRKAAQQSVVVRRRQRGLGAEPLTGGTTAAGGRLTLEAMGTRDGASALVENARLLTKEQLVYALRLTGAKLNDVRQKAQKAEARP